MGERQRVLIIHGWTNRRWPGHWQRRAATALRAAGNIVCYPQLPDTDNPRVDDWLGVLESELAMLHEVEGGEIVVLAHSLGCLTWLHGAARGTLTGVDRVLLVAPADPDLCGEVPTFQLDVDDSGLRNAVRVAAGSTRVVASEADPWLPRGAQQTFAGPLDLPLTTVVGAAHFAIEDGWGPWQGVIDWAINANADLSAR